MSIKSVRIVGSGLIGTSIGLGLSAKGIDVFMGDIDPRAQKLAQDLVGKAGVGPAELTIFAVPTSSLKSVVPSEFALNPKSKFIDIGSVKTKPIVEVITGGIPKGRFCPTHPMAGREIGGAESARADLFLGRPWIFSPAGVDADVIEAALEQPHQADTLIKSFEREIDRGLGVFSWFIYRITSPAIRDLFMHPRNIFNVKGAVISVLAGDLFRDTRLGPSLWAFRAIYYIKSWLMRHGFVPSISR